MKFRNRIQKGYTLVELLVVLSIISTLAAFSVAAVIKAIDVVRVTQCQNNLKQFGPAFKAFAAGHASAAREKYPVNYALDPEDLDCVGKSWITDLLQELNQPNLHRLITPDVGLDGSSYSGGDSNDKAAEANLQAAKTTPELFVCSASASSERAPFVPCSELNQTTSILTDQELGITCYKAVLGSNWGEGMTDYKTSWEHNPSGTTRHSASEYCAREATSYSGRHIFVPLKHGDQNKSDAIPSGPHRSNCDGLDHGDGYMPRHAVPLNAGGGKRGTLRNIKDPQATTLVVGEVLPERCFQSSWYHWNGALATAAFPPNWEPENDKEFNTAYTAGTGDAFNENQEVNFSFRSGHSGKTNFLCADTSIKSIVDDIDLRVYRSMATINGRETHFYVENGDGEESISIDEWDSY